MANDLGQYLLKKTEAYCKKCVAIFLLFFVTKAFLPKMYVMQNKKFIFGFEVAYCLHFFLWENKNTLVTRFSPLATWWRKRTPSLPSCLNVRRKSSFLQVTSPIFSTCLHSFLLQGIQYNIFYRFPVLYFLQVPSTI